MESRIHRDHQMSGGRNGTRCVPYGYATFYRYPAASAVLEPSQTEFDEALKAATGLMGYVLSPLPGEVSPT